jgi:cyclopropane-fatty-acyl-phospholipid synthase
MSQHRARTISVDTGTENSYQDDRLASRVTGLDRWLARHLTEQLGDAPVTISLWDGKPVMEPLQESIGGFRFRDRRALWSVIKAPELGLGDSYTRGGIEITGDLIEVLFRVYQSLDTGPAPKMKRNILGRLPTPSRNTATSSKEHIHHHYDIGTDFYRLWLDENMVYTCAYYPTQSATLEEAQLAKMDHVCRKLELRPGQSVVEAGCGWGSLALHMAKHHGVNVRAFNISEEQIKYARERASALGLADRVEFIQDDYRNLSGQYDAFVSVGMLEHVGTDYYATLGGIINRCLKRHGRGLVHSVGRSRPTAPNAWLERRIFPGSYPPSLREMMAVFEPYSFSVLDVENLRLHYARTLTEWLNRFDAAADTVREMFDEPFVRGWRLYLGGCAAAFLSSSLQLFQILFASPVNNSIPLTRGYMHANETSEKWKTLEA